MMLTAVGGTLVFAIVLLGLAVVFRRLWLALVVFGVLTLTLSWPAEASDFSLIGVACSFGATLAGMAAMRFGLLGMLTLCFCAFVWVSGKPRLRNAIARSS